MKNYTLALTLIPGLLWGIIACNPTTEQQLRGPDLTYIDSTISPGDDFFNHVNKKWLDEAEIPPSESSWGSFITLRMNAVEHLQAIMEEALQADAEKGSITQKVGDLYYTGMDTNAIEAAGLKYIQEDLDKLRNAGSKEDLMKEMADMWLRGGGGFFRPSVRSDLKNSEVYALYFYQGGIGMPKEYYLEEGPRFDHYREEYKKYLNTLLTLAEGDAGATDDVFEFEKQLAEISKSRRDLRNPYENYFKKSYEDAAGTIANLDLGLILQNLGVPEVDSVVLGQPEFLAGMNALVAKTSLETLKAYLEVNYLSSNANYLPEAFVEASFEFNSKTMRGVSEMDTREKETSERVGRLIGQLVGQLYVKEHFSQEAKDRVNTLVNDLRIAFARRIERLDWMSEETKVQAKNKLEAIRQKLGYPDEWRDYSGLEIDRESYLQNVNRIREFDTQYRYSRVGQQVDRDEWFMSPQTVNAGYSPTNNDITFPAGILQPPFFNPDAVDAVNYGSIGTVIGHEITHGFDDSGSKYDAQGNLNNWWTEEDRKRFDELTQKMVDQFDAYTVLDSVHVDGRLTLGENIADLGGIAIAFEAMQIAMERDGRPETTDGLSPEQQFFIGYANLWRTKYRDDALLNRIKTDPHSPGIYRVNGPLSNSQSFYKAFGVENGNKMFREDMIEIW